MHSCASRSFGCKRGPFRSSHAFVATTAKRSSDRNRNHVFRHIVRKSQPGIKARRYDIDQPVIVHDLKAYLRKRFKKPGHERNDHHLRRYTRGVDLETARWPVTEDIHLIDGLAHLVERRLQARKQMLPSLRQGHAPGGPVEQADTQPLLQAAYCVADRRRRQVRLSGATLEAAVTGDRNENRQVIELSLGHDW